MSTLKPILVVMVLSATNGTRSFGGVDSVCQMHLQGLLQYAKPHEVFHVLAFNPANDLPCLGKVMKLAPHLTLEWHNLAQGTKGLYSHLPHFIGQELLVRKTIKRVKPTLVHSHIYSWPTLRYGGVPKLLTLHSWGKIGRHGRGKMNNFLHERVLQPLSLATAAGVASVSKQIGALVGKGCTYVPNPVTPAFFEPLKPAPSLKKGVQLILSGAVSPLKRTADALDILARARKVFPDTSLIIAGGYNPQSAYFKYLQKKQMALGLQNHITWAGLLSTPELLKALDASHIGLSVSGSETFGLAPLEMMARGLPVVATRVGVMDWDGQALQALGATCFEVGDTASAAEEVLKLMKKGSPERLPKITPKALQKAYGLEAFMEAYRQRYQEILA